MLTVDEERALLLETLLDYPIHLENWVLAVLPDYLPAAKQACLYMEATRVLWDKKKANRMKATITRRIKEYTR